MRVPPSVINEYFQTRQYSIALTASTPARVMPAVADRISFVVSPATGIALSIWPDSTVSTTKGFLVNSAAPVLILTYADVGVLVTSEWWAVAVGGNGNFNAIETIFGQGLNVDLSQG